MGSREGDRRRRWVVEEIGGECEKIGGGVFRRRWVVKEIGGGDG